MVKAPPAIDISTIVDAEALAALAENVCRTRTPLVLQRGGEAVALLVLADSGEALSTGPTDISSNKHTYLAQAAAAEATPTAIS